MPITVFRAKKSLTRSARDKKIIQNREQMHKRIRQKMGTPKCGSGKLIKEGYKRRSYFNKSGSRIKSTTVAPTCIPARGRSHKGKQLFVLDKGTLGKYGYHNVDAMSTTQRHIALRKALKNMPPLSVYRKLNAVYVVKILIEQLPTYLKKTEIGFKLQTNIKIDLNQNKN
jgi:hypothetical protein